jgi:hypothetical protein
MNSVFWDMEHLMVLCGGFSYHFINSNVMCAAVWQMEELKAGILSYKENFDFK